MADIPSNFRLIELANLIKLCGESVNLFCTSVTARSLRMAEIGMICELAGEQLLDIALDRLHTGPDRETLASDPQRIGFAVTDLDGQFLYANKCYCELVGYKSSQMRTLTILKLTHKDDRARNGALLNALLREGTAFKIKKRYVRADSTTLWVENEVFKLDGGTDSILLARCRPSLMTEHLTEEIVDA